MPRIETPVTRLLGIRYPVIQAGMSWASSSAALPLAVSRAGGLGQIAAGPMRPAALSEAIRDVRAGTDHPFAVNMPLYRPGAEEILDLLAQMRPPAIVASQGGPDRYLHRFKDLGVICVHTVASVAHARKAAQAGVDALVVVGGEAGGHPPPDMVSTLVNLRAVARAVPEIPLIAAGGFADGHGLAAALALGAGAASFGTRFLATPEATVSDAYKARVLAGGVADTYVVGRDLGVIRALGNDFTRRMCAAESQGATLEERRTIFRDATLKAAALEGDTDGGKLEAGQSAGLVDDLCPAGELVAQIVSEYARARASLPEVTVGTL